MAKYDPEVASHKAWLGLLQPVGLVVSPPALVKAQAVLAQNVVELQQAVLAIVRWPPGKTQSDEADPYLDDFPTFAERVLGWDVEDLAGSAAGPDLPEDLEVVLPDYHETLRPTHAVVDSMGGGEILMLVQVVPVGTDLDAPSDQDSKTGWHASPQAKIERLLREKEVPAGLLCNGHELRLVYAPRGESSGHLTFPVPAMCEVGGRPILGALHMLLSEHRVFSALAGRRLLDLLGESRKYQAEVSTKLSEQVLGALWELLRGFQAADEAANGQLMGEMARENPSHIYGGLQAVLLRLVFLLYAEDQGLMPAEEVYARNYSVTGLFVRLRSDAGRYPDTMDQRYGAWACLLSLFRLVYDGGSHGRFHLPTRHGQLFDPDEYPFLEGRADGENAERFEAPRVSDGCIYRVLDSLLILEGERLSYRALDVEQIGSVYEAMMGFEVERAQGLSIGIRRRKQGMNLDIIVSVEELLALDGGKRKKWLKDEAACELTGKAVTALKDATTSEDIVAALGRKLSPRTPRLLPQGALYLQPGEERRRSGSHYTPRELTEPIVRTTLQPVLEALGERPTPQQILDLKVCDPAMGSGAFLVEACRQLAEHLREAWEVHDCMPELPPDEDALLHARRLVAQRCLYGVDKNPFAVNLAKLSLWLVTLAREHAFTFLDHAFKHGDSLVGLTRAQIRAFDWKQRSKERGPLFEEIGQNVEEATQWREALQELDENDYRQKNEAWREAEDVLYEARLVGDLVIAAFFGAEKDKERETLRLTYRNKVDAWKKGSEYGPELQGIVEKLRGSEKPVPPFHWEIEFPEVFGRENPGFDTFVGNPPFLGGARIWRSLGACYPDWIRSIHVNSGGKAVDLVAHFFRRGFELLRSDACLGLIATNTVAQGDTRLAGLKQLCAEGGEIFGATRRLRWPGAAAVVVSVVFVRKGQHDGQKLLDTRTVPGLNSFLFPSVTEFDPVALRKNGGMCFQGACVLGMGFTFDDTDTKGVASSIDTMHELIRSDPRNSERILPYIGGKEVNSDPRHEHHRFVIDFGDLTLEQAAQWPQLLDVVRQKVKPGRDKLGGYSVAERRREYWWQYGTATPALNTAKHVLSRVIAVTRHQHFFAVSFLSGRSVFAESLIVFPLDTYAAFGALQSRLHEIWARFFGSSMKDDLRYTPADCFETFPFPTNWQTHPVLEATGKACYEFRAALMVRNDEGLTKTYNRLHDPDERDPDTLKLRELHAAMDRAVLDAYGWTDIPTDYEFLLDYEIDEENWSPRKKKPWRYRWPEEVHDEVLARLLDLNQKRYDDEVLYGLHSKQKLTKKVTGKNPQTNRTGGALPLFEAMASEEE